MATMIRGAGAAYDVRPAGENRSVYGGPIRGLAGMLADAVRGACSGLLALLGGAHITGAANTVTPAGGGLESLPGILEQFSYGGMAGPAEMLGGIVLFLTARRTIARTLGLLLFVGLVAGYANGYTLADMLGVLSSLLQVAAGALENAAAQTA